MTSNDTYLILAITLGLLGVKICVSYVYTWLGMDLDFKHHQVGYNLVIFISHLTM